MRKSGRCPKCSGQKLLVIDPFQQVTDGSAQVVPLATALYPGKPLVQAGQLAAVVCCACGYLEWYASGIEQILAELGDLYPGARLFDRDLHQAVTEVGLSVDMEGAHGWQLKASGVIEQVPLSVGQWARKRLWPNGIRRVLFIEILAGTRADMGEYAVRRRDAEGREPGVAYETPILIGDEGFDSVFEVFYNGPAVGELTAAVAQGITPVGSVPWLDDEARELFLAARPEETVIVQRNVGMLLRDYDADTFPHAVALAVHLARWKGPSTHAYR